MEFLPWRTEYEVGIEVLDTEHKRLVTIVNTLYHNMIPGMSDSCFTGMIQSLIDIAGLHFRHEEELWTDTGYPEADAHHRHHVELLRMIESYRDVIADRKDPEQSLENMRFLRAWVMDHIKADDMRLAQYLNERHVK